MSASLRISLPVLLIAGLILLAVFLLLTLLVLLALLVLLILVLTALIVVLHITCFLSNKLRAYSLSTALLCPASRFLMQYFFISVFISGREKNN